MSNASIRLNNHDYSLDESRLQESVSHFINEHGHLGMGLGNAAGYSIKEAFIEPHPWYRKDSHVWSNGESDEYTQQRGELVVRCTGMELAHGGGDDRVHEKRFPMVLPVGTEKIVLK